MAKKYLKIDFKTAQFYEYSKEPREGFEPVAGAFRKYYDEGITGELKNCSIYNSDSGSIINLEIDVSGTTMIAGIRLHDQRRNVDNGFAENIISFLGNLQKGQTYRFYPYKLDGETQKQFDAENGREIRPKYYDRYGISIKDANGQKVPRYLTNSKDVTGETKIPQLDWVPDPLNPSKKTPTAVSRENRNNFLIAALLKATDGHLAKTTSAPTSSEQVKAPSQPATPQAVAQPVAQQQAPQQQTNQAATTAAVQEVATLESEDDYDDLPF